MPRNMPERDDQGRFVSDDHRGGAETIAADVRAVAAMTTAAAETEAD
jgi:hypothetical protein